MFLSVRHKPVRKEAMMHEVINRDTGENIPKVVWANDETGRYRRFLTDENGMLIREGDHMKSKIFKGNIRLRRMLL